MTRGLAALLIAIPSAARAGGGGGAGAADLLMHDAAARSAGLAGTYAAIGDDLASLWTNPAGMAALEGTSIVFQHGMTAAGIPEPLPAFEFLGFAQSLRPGASAGLVALYRAPKTLANPAAEYAVNDPPAEFRDLAVCLGGGATLRALGFGDAPLEVGAAVKVVNSRIRDMGTTGFAVDAGARFHLASGLDLGVSAQNLGPGLKFRAASDPMPARVRAGAAYRLDLGKAGSARLAGEFGFHLAESAPTGSIGAEYAWERMIFARVGYRILGTPSAQSLSAGLGVRYAGLSVDYAVRPMDFAGISAGLGHYASIGLQFAAPTPDRHARATATARATAAPLDATPTAAAAVTSAAPDPAAARKVAESLHQQGLQYYQAGDLVSALLEFQKAQRVDATHAPSKEMFAKAKAELEASREQVAKSQGDVNVQRVIQEHFNKGVKSFSDGDYRGAISEYQIVLELSSNHPQALAQLDTAKKRLDAAVGESLAAAQQARGKRDLAREIRAWQMALRHDPANAAAKKGLAEGQERIPTEVKRLYQVGIDLYTKDQVEQALAMWKQAQELDPNSEQIRKAIERAESRLGEQKLRGK